jgi:hypothetical protein
MIFLQIAQSSSRWLRFVVFFFALFVILPPPLQAACPQGTDFATRNSYNEDVPVSQPDLAVNEGSYSLSMDLSLPVGDVGLNISSGGTPTVTISPNRWQWRLRVRQPATVTAADLQVSYEVYGSDGTPGVFTSVQDPTSQAQVTVTTREITQIDKRNQRIFLGFIDLEIDYSNSTRAGNYRGTINVTVDCP